MPHRSEFYLYRRKKTRGTYWYVCFVDPRTGRQETAKSIEQALELVRDEEEAFIIGGGSIYLNTWDKADRLYLTRVHASPEGEITIPEVKTSEWQEISREDHSADEKNEYAYSFINYCRKRGL